MKEIKDPIQKERQNNSKDDSKENSGPGRQLSSQPRQQTAQTGESRFS